jgi:hypothetical protein
MNAYVNRCHDGLIETSKTLLAERFAEPVLVPAKHIDSEEDEMSSMLERARAELGATNKRIDECKSVIAAKQETLDVETARQLELEEYIKDHEVLANKAAALLQILPPVIVEKVAETNVHVMKKTRGPYKKREAGSNVSSLLYGIGEIRAKVYPILRAKGLQTFNKDQVIAAIAEAGLEPGPSKSQLSTWLFADKNSKSSAIIKASGPGEFAFKEPIVGSDVAAAEEHELRHA